jgi:hypothetical protein
MDSSVSPKDEIWFLRVCRHIWNAVYLYTWITILQPQKVAVDTRQPLYVQRKIEVRSRNHCCCGKAMCYIFWVCVFVALVIQHAMRMRRIMLSSVACPAIQYFFHITSQTVRISKKKVTGHKMCVLIFSTTFVWNISHFEKNSTWYHHKCTYTGLSAPCTVPYSDSCQILMKLKLWYLFNRAPSI